MNRKSDRAVTDGTDRKAAIEGPSSALTDDASEPSGFEFGSRRARLLFEEMVESFIDDYFKKRSPSDGSGWRSLGQLAKRLRVQPSSMYGRRGWLSPEVADLVRRGLAETRIFRGERGRGGEVTRLRICYENDTVRDHVRDRVRRASHGRTTGRVALPGGRLAVLPFVNLSPDPRDEYFADGMTEELTDRLAQVKQLKVIARTSVMSYKGEKKKAAQIAKELEVGALVDGSVRKVGDRVRVSVQLLSGGTEEHLWSSHYDGSLGDIFAVQSEIAEEVAGELKVQLLQSEKESLEKKPTENTEAYDAYLRGRFLMNKGLEEAVRKALGYFQEALEMDPGYVKAYTGIADCYATMVDRSYVPWFVGVPKARAAAETALELDKDLPEAHASMVYPLMLEYDLEGAERELEEAIRLNPRYGFAHHLHALLLLIQGRFEEASVETKLAEDADPLSPMVLHISGYVAWNLGKDAQAVEKWRRGLELNPEHDLSHFDLASYFLTKSLRQEALGELKQFDCPPNENREHWAMAAFLYGRLGDEGEASRRLQRLLTEFEASSSLAGQLAWTYAGLGDADKFYEWLAKCVEDKVTFLVFLKANPLLERMRSDPRYGDFLAAWKIHA